MRNMMGIGLRSGLPQLVTQIVVLWLVSVLAQTLAARLPIPVPPGAVGMGLVFVLLCIGALRLSWIERGAMLLVRHLGLFLIPYAVSIMAVSDRVLASGLALVVALIGSTAIGMAATGWTAQSAAQALADRSKPVERVGR